MKRLQLIALVLLVAMTSCRKAPEILTTDTGTDKEEQTGQPTTSSVIIRAGTSFGMCMGYCITEIDVVDTKATFTERSGRGDSSQFPTRTTGRTLTTAELNCLKDAIDIDAFMKLDSIIGCPDCADGGAEWIEIMVNGKPRRVTFEYGKELPEIQPLLDRVRALRAGFKKEAYIYQPWEWKQSNGGIAGMTLTPESTGYTERRIYRRDGTLSILRNGQPFASTTYTITHERTDFTGRMEDVIRYGEPGMEPQIMRISSDTLYLTDMCYDCFGHTYTGATTICD